MKKAFSVLSAVLLMGALASCGNTSASGSNSGSGSGGGNTPAGPKEITFWHCIGHDKMASLERVIEEFNNAHKDTDGYYVTAEKIAGDYDSLHDAIKTRLNAGRVPSITMGYPDSFAEYLGDQGVEKTKILNLDNFIDNDPDFHPETMVSEYYEEGQEYQYEGTWSVPLYKSTEVMYYNVTEFQKTNWYKTHKDETRNVTNDDGTSYTVNLTQPKTWDWNTLIEVCTAIQNERGSQADFHALGYDSDANLLISQMAQRGIPYTDGDPSYTGADEYKHYAWMDPSTGAPNAKLVDFCVELYNLSSGVDVSKQVLVTQGTYGTYASDLFLQQKVMFTVGSTGGSAYNDPNGKFQAALVPVPSYHNNHKYIMQGPSLCFFDTKDSAKEQAAWEFYSQYLSDPELNAGVALENSYDPVRTSSYESQDYKDWCAAGVVADNGQPGASFSDTDNLNAPMANRIPNLTAQYAESQWYVTSPVFMGSGTAREEIGLVLSYARQSSKANVRDKIVEALTKAYSNCRL